MVQFMKATENQLGILARTRAEVLRAANGLPADADMSEAEAAAFEYYCDALPRGEHVAYLAIEEGVVVGTGGVSFYGVMPTYHNPTGKKAYIMNMYTAPKYRRRGIATRMLEILVGEAHRRGITAISLEATPAGRPLYEKFGFVPMAGEMELPPSEESHGRISG